MDKKTNQQIYTISTVILEIFGYKTNIHKENYPPWRGIEAKMNHKGKFVNYQNCSKDIHEIQSNKALPDD